MSDTSHWFSRAWSSVWGALHDDAGQERPLQKIRSMSNDSLDLLLVVTEPEGQDFWLRPGETFELRAAVETEFDDFELTSEDQEVIVSPSAGMGCISVWQRGRELRCGHQRPTE